MGRFTGKVVIVTGAASGIGEGAAKRFAEEGATLVLGDLDGGALAELKGKLGGGPVETLAGDVSRNADCEAKHGVRVNAVNPSLTYTALTAGMKEQPELIAKFEERIPMGRGAEPDDLAPVIAFLASDDALRDGGQPPRRRRPLRRQRPAPT